MLRLESIGVSAALKQPAINHVKAHHHGSEDDAEEDISSGSVRVWDIRPWLTTTTAMANWRLYDKGGDRHKDGSRQHDHDDDDDDDDGEDTMWYGVLVVGWLVSGLFDGEKMAVGRVRIVN